MMQRGNRAAPAFTGSAAPLGAAVCLLLLLGAARPAAAPSVTPDPAFAPMAWGPALLDVRCATVCASRPSARGARSDAPLSSACAAAPLRRQAGRDERDRLIRETTTTWRNTAQTVELDAAHTVASGYDLLGNRIVQVVDRPDGTTRRVDSAYDPANRLATITDHGDGGAVTTYSYDIVGNRTGMTRPGGLVDAYTFDALSRVQTATTTTNFQDKKGARGKIHEQFM